MLLTEEILKDRWWSLGDPPSMDSTPQCGHCRRHFDLHKATVTHDEWDIPTIHCAYKGCGGTLQDFVFV